ncbi:hypothetical protein [Plasmodium yoelii yoelii]|uniref:Uncharacterized protein n=1 Tax=Plasmodium yoelii yoelii TaxID=73239 RepID=Q7RLR1_PLAYO|nr:hypothetical protein [Plasmodium yoelii yoelii]
MPFNNQRRAEPKSEAPCSDIFFPYLLFGRHTMKI